MLPIAITLAIITSKYTFEFLKSFTAILRESSDSIKRDRAPVLNLQHSAETNMRAGLF